MNLNQPLLQSPGEPVDHRAIAIHDGHAREVDFAGAIAELKATLVRALPVVPY
jgi:hypothetical protein